MVTGSVPVIKMSRSPVFHDHIGILGKQGASHLLRDGTGDGRHGSHTGQSRRPHHIESHGRSEEVFFDGIKTLEKFGPLSDVLLQLQTAGRMRFVQTKSLKGLRERIRRVRLPDSNLVRLSRIVFEIKPGTSARYIFRPLLSDPELTIYLPFPMSATSAIGQGALNESIIWTIISRAFRDHRHKSFLSSRRKSPNAARLGSTQIRWFRDRLK